MVKLNANPHFRQSFSDVIGFCCSRQGIRFRTDLRTDCLCFTHSLSRSSPFPQFQTGGPFGTETVPPLDKIPTKEFIEKFLEEDDTMPAGNVTSQGFRTEPQDNSPATPRCVTGHMMVCYKYNPCYLRPVLAFWYCLCLYLSVCPSVRPSVRPCVNPELVRAITCDPFKSGSPFGSHLG